MTYQDFLRLKPGQTFIVFQRYGQPWVERRVIKRITRTSLISAPIDNLNADSVISVSKNTFKQEKEQDVFAIGLLGKTIVKCRVIQETKTKP